MKASVTTRVKYVELILSWGRRNSLITFSDTERKIYIDFSNLFMSVTNVQSVLLWKKTCWHINIREDYSVTTNRHYGESIIPRTHWHLHCFVCLVHLFGWEDISEHWGQARNILSYLKHHCNGLNVHICFCFDPGDCCVHDIPEISWVKWSFWLSDSWGFLWGYIIDGTALYTNPFWFIGETFCWVALFEFSWPFQFQTKVTIIPPR